LIFCFDAPPAPRIGATGSILAQAFRSVR
jgi:hypothetical protein